MVDSILLKAEETRVVLVYVPILENKSHWLLTLDVFEMWGAGVRHWGRN